MDTKPRIGRPENGGLTRCGPSRRGRFAHSGCGVNQRNLIGRLPKSGAVAYEHWLSNQAPLFHDLFDISKECTDFILSTRPVTGVRLLSCQ